MTRILVNCVLVVLNVAELSQVPKPYSGDFTLSELLSVVEPRDSSCLFSDSFIKVFW